MDVEGRPPLHHAVMRGHAKVVELLLEMAGPQQLLQRDMLGSTAVHLAAVQNHVRIKTQDLRHIP